MTFGAATGGRGDYRTYDASILFINGIMQLPGVKKLSFAVWCVIPIQVRSILNFVPLVLTVLCLFHSRSLEHFIVSRTI